MRVYNTRTYVCIYVYIMICVRIGERKGGENKNFFEIYICIADIIQ